MIYLEEEQKLWETLIEPVLPLNKQRSIENFFLN